MELIELGGVGDRENPTPYFPEIKMTPNPLEMY